MAAPNLLALTSVYLKTKAVAIVSGGVDVLENPAGSGKVFLIKNLTIPNIDGVNNADVTVNFYDASAAATTPYHKTVTAPADATFDAIVGGSPKFLEEGDKITASGPDGDLVADVSWVELG